MAVFSPQLSKMGFVTSTEYDKQFKGTIFEVFKENGSSFIKRIK